MATYFKNSSKTNFTRNWVDFYSTPNEFKNCPVLETEMQYYKYGDQYESYGAPGNIDALTEDLFTTSYQMQSSDVTIDSDATKIMTNFKTSLEDCRSDYLLTIQLTDPNYVPTTSQFWPLSIERNNGGYWSNTVFLFKFAWNTKGG